MVEQFRNNFIVDSGDLSIQEKFRLILEKEMLYNELEFNPQYDEYITFSHYYSVYQNFDCEIAEVEHFPFLVQCEYLNSSFLFKKPFLDPLKASPASIIGRVKQFSGSRDDAFKKDFLENIKIYSEIIGIETTSFLLIPALAKIVDDSMIIKNKFLSVLPPFIDYLNSKEVIGYEIIKTNIFNIIEELFHPNLYLLNDLETKAFLFECFIKIGKIISVKEKEIILKQIICFANEETQEPLKTEMRFLCMRSIDKLADVFGKEICDNYFIPQLYSFSFELDSFMRMEVLKILPNVAQETSLNLITTKLYEILLNMSKDATYKVRKTCVETLPKIIKINKERALKTHYNSKNSLFIDIIDVLIYDNNKEVRLTVLENIGEIIHQLAREELSIKLFDFYRNSIEEYYFNIRDNEIEGRYNSTAEMEKMVYYFAYNFPAVLYCYGAEYWPQLKNIYKNLCDEKEKTIKRSIISSLHEIANIIGKDKTESDLLPIYDKYLQSTDKTEKNLAMRNLPKILQIVSKETKETYFKYFEAMSLFKDNDNNLRKFNFVNWKNKLDVVESILFYYNLYEYDIIYKQIIPPCLSFCLDDVYLVRKTSSRVLANILSYLYKSNYHKNKLINIIHSFAFNKNIQMRVIFVKMCKVFFNYYLIFKEVICDLLYILLQDKLIDSRISLAKLLSKIISNEKAFLFKDKEIHKMCQILVAKEKSQTIQSYLKNKNIIEIGDKEIKEEKSINIESKPPVFKHNMNSLIIEFKLQIPIEDEENDKHKKSDKIDDDNDSYGDEEYEEGNKDGENKKIIIEEDMKELIHENNKEIQKEEENKDIIPIYNEKDITSNEEINHQLKEDTLIHENKEETTIEVIQKEEEIIIEEKEKTEVLLEDIIINKINDPVLDDIIPINNEISNDVKIEKQIQEEKSQQNDLEIDNKMNDRKVNDLNKEEKEDKINIIVDKELLIREEDRPKLHDFTEILIQNSNLYQEQIRQEEIKEIQIENNRELLIKGIEVLPTNNNVLVNDQIKDLEDNKVNENNQEMEPMIKDGGIKEENININQENDNDYIETQEKDKKVTEINQESNLDTQQDTEMTNTNNISITNEEKKEESISIQENKQNEKENESDKELPTTEEIKVPKIEQEELQIEQSNDNEVQQNQDQEVITEKKEKKKRKRKKK